MSTTTPNPLDLVKDVAKYLAVAITALVLPVLATSVVSETVALALFLVTIYVAGRYFDHLFR